LAVLQVNLRRLLAFAVVSHTSVLVIGLFSLGNAGFQGSMMLSVNFGLAIAGLVFMTGLVYHRTQTTLLSRLGGLFDRLPLIGIAFLVAGLSIVGMPGTPGFDAAHLVLEDAMHNFGALVTTAAALGNVVAAGFLLWAFQRAFLAASDGKRPHLEVARASFLERLLAAMVILLLLGVGFYSEPWLELIEQPAQALSSDFAPAPPVEGHRL
jgi:NADH-quinone oxidoreductase subunit M